MEIDATTALAVAAVLLVALFALANGHRKAPKGTEPIPSVPGGLPVLGQVFEMLKSVPWDLMTHWALKHGPIYKFHLFGKDCVCVADPALLKEIMHTKMTSFTKDTGFTYGPFMCLLGTGLVTSEGKTWRDSRTSVSKVLRVDILEEIPSMTKRAVERLAEKLEQCKRTNTPMEIAEEFRHLTLQVIAEALLSIGPEESDAKFAKLYLPIVTECNARVWFPWRSFLPTPTWFQHRQHINALNEYITSLIVDRWNLRRQEAASGKTPRQADILDRLLSTVPEADWNPKTLHHLRDGVKTFVLAGHETSAAMLTWALYELIKNPQCMDEARAEALSVYGKNYSAGSAIPPRAALDTLNYTEAALKEALRKYSVVPTVVRLASEDVVVGKYFIPKGTSVMLLIQGVHQRPDIWENPMKYEPRRFLEDVPLYHFLGFIEGPRNCLGQYLSLLETKTVLSTLVHRFKFTIENENANERHPYIVPIVPHHGLFVRVSDHKYK